MIEYHKLGQDFAVKLDGERVGTIRAVLNGWRYYPLHSKTGGETFAYLADCKKSLEKSA